MNYSPYTTFGTRNIWTAAEEELFLLVNSEMLPETADAVVWIEGDAEDRVKKTVEVWEHFGRSLPLVLSGGVKGNPFRPDAEVHPDGGNIPSWEIKENFIQAGVPETFLILEDKSLNARDQSVHVIRMAKEKGWRRIILVASLWHQMRLFLTFLKQLQIQQALAIELVNAPETRFPLERKIPGRGKDTYELIPEELWRITQYIENGSMVGAEEGGAYMNRFQKQFNPTQDLLKKIQKVHDRMNT